MRRLGYRRPALVVLDLNNHISNNLWSGAFLDWQLQLPAPDRCEPYIPNEAENCANFYAWLDVNQPDSLLVYKVPVRRFLAKRGLLVPDDVGVAYLYRTFDEMGAAAAIDGNLSAVGSAALDLVVEKLNANRTGADLLPIETRNQFLRFPQHCGGEKNAARTSNRGMPADNRHSVGLRSSCHTVPNFGGLW